LDDIYSHVDIWKPSAQIQEMMDALHLTPDDEPLLKFPDEFSNLSDEN
jgi:hypothetical protein